MVATDKINTIDNQPELIQPVEAEKSHLIPNEENQSNDSPFNSNDNPLEEIVPIDSVNSPSVPYTVPICIPSIVFPISIPHLYLVPYTLWNKENARCSDCLVIDFSWHQLWFQRKTND